MSAANLGPLRRPGDHLLMGSAFRSIYPASRPDSLSLIAGRAEQDEASHELGACIIVLPLLTGQRPPGRERQSMTQGRDHPLKRHLSTRPSLEQNLPRLLQIEPVPRNLFADRRHFLVAEHIQHHAFCLAIPAVQFSQTDPQTLIRVFHLRPAPQLRQWMHRKPVARARIEKTCLIGKVAVHRRAPHARMFRNRAD